MAAVNFFTRLHVKCTARTTFGEVVYLVGDAPGLGCWNSTQGVPLNTNADTFPVWENTAPISVPSGVAIEYKYVVCVDGQFKRWEDVPANRRIVPNGEDMVMEDELDKAPEVQPPDEKTITFDLPPETADIPSSPSVMQLDDSDAVMVVSYILPVVITQDGDKFLIEWNHDSIIAQKQRNLTENMRVLWVGCPSIHVDEEDEERLAQALMDHNCVAVFLDKELANDFYFGFCRSFLWPRLHNVVHAYTKVTESFNQKVWRAYCTVNRKFADKVMEVYETGDLIWVHDYHLLLLPSYILRRLRTPNVGLFLHTPFPSSEIFRTISVRDELLRGMLNADLIGFHLFEYARHFLTCCKRMLGLEYEFRRGGFLGVRDHKRNVMVQVSHAGIEPDNLTEATKDATSLPSLHERPKFQHLVQLASAKTLMLGIDEVDGLKGLPLKLLGFEALMENCPQWRGKVCFVQIGVKARNFTPAVEEEYNSVKSEVVELVARINEAHPNSVFFEEEPTIHVEHRMALWALAEIAVFSPIREGVNTFPLEYIYARRADAGVVILSEFASCSRVLNGALRCNPWNTEELQGHMDRALCMSANEKQARHLRDLEFITSNTTSIWAERFFVDLKRLRRKEDEQWTSVGFGLAGFRVVGMGTTFRPLEATDVLTAYRKALRRAIFLDWGGTLVPVENAFQASLNPYYLSQLPAPVQMCLEELSQDPRNLLMVLSGQERSRVDQAFGKVQGISLAAEHGYLYKLGSMPGASKLGVGHWDHLIEGADDSWKEVCHAILRAYTTRTNGSYIQNKGSSLVWKYDEADPEFGAMQAKELRDHLEGVLVNYPVSVNVGKGYLEVRPKGVNKGTMVDHIVSLLYTSSGGVDFVLCIGDDSADEYMFSALLSRFNTGRSMGMAQPVLFTCTVGRKPSAAHYYLNDHDEVLELLQSLRLHSTRSNRNRSMTDLARLSSEMDRGATEWGRPSQNPFSPSRSTEDIGRHTEPLPRKNFLTNSASARSMAGSVPPSKSMGRMPGSAGRTANSAGPKMQFGHGYGTTPKSSMSRVQHSPLQEEGESETDSDKQLEDKSGAPHPTRTM